jgi:hypothetical protein
MDTAALTPVAEMLISSYFDTASFSRSFTGQFNNPPSMLTKSHYLRSVMQASMTHDQRFDLSSVYAEFGRVEFTDRSAERSYLLRSDGAMAFERVKDSTLFDPVKFITSDIIMLVYKFHEVGLDLSVVGTKKRHNRARLQATGTPVYINTWPYETGGPGHGTFNQGGGDPFGDVGPIRHEESSRLA